MNCALHNKLDLSSRNFIELQLESPTDTLDFELGIDIEGNIRVGTLVPERRTLAEGSLAADVDELVARLDSVEKYCLVKQKPCCVLATSIPPAAAF